MDAIFIIVLHSEGRVKQSNGPLHDSDVTQPRGVELAVCECSEIKGWYAITLFMFACIHGLCVLACREKESIISIAGLSHPSLWNGAPYHILGIFL